MYLSNDRDHVAPCQGNSSIPTNATQSEVVIPCRSLRQGPIVCRDTSVSNYSYTLINFPEKRSSPLIRGGSLDSWKRCVSAQYVPRTHLATLVAKRVLFPPNLVGLVPLVVGDISMSVSEASGGFKTFYGKNIRAFCLQKTRVSLLGTGYSGFRLLHSRKLSHACHRILRFLLLEVSCSGDS
jgi:hypothetical protein